MPARPATAVRAKRLRESTGESLGSWKQTRSSAELHAERAPSRLRGHPAGITNLQLPPERIPGRRAVSAVQLTTAAPSRPPGEPKGGFWRGRGGGSKVLRPSPSRITKPRPGHFRPARWSHPPNFGSDKHSPPAACPSRTVRGWEGHYRHRPPCWREDRGRGTFDVRRNAAARRERDSRSNPDGTAQSGIRIYGPAY